MPNENVAETQFIMDHFKANPNIQNIEVIRLGNEGDFKNIDNSKVTRCKKKLGLIKDTRVYTKKKNIVIDKISSEELEDNTSDLISQIELEQKRFEFYKNIESCYPNLQGVYPKIASDTCTVQLEVSRTLAQLLLKRKVELNG